MKDNESNVTSSVVSLIINIFSIVVLILNIICFFKLRYGDNSMLLLCSIFNIIDLILSGGKGLTILIPFVIFNFIYHKNIWLAIELSLLYEQVLCCIFFVIFIPLGLLMMKKNK